MIVDRRRFIVLGAACSVCPRMAAAAPVDYPTRPVRVVLGFPAGGTADVLTRIVAEWLQARLGQPFIIENRPGAGTNIATEAVVRAPADGYTLLATTTSNLLNGALYDDLKYDFVRDIAPVASLTRQALVLLTGPLLAVDSMPKLIAHAKANPGQLNIGHFGTGTVSHLAGELLKRSADIDVVQVPYRGSTPMLADLLGGRIHAAFDNVPAAIEHIRSGSLRALAVSTAGRSEALPGVPAVAEFIADYDVFSVAGIGAPAGTPADIVATLDRVINAGLADPAVKARIGALGAEVMAGSAAAFSGLIRRETDKWGRLIKASGIRIN